MAITLNGTTGITTPTTSTTGEFVTSVTAFKNRIINGAMVIDQRNAGASVSTASGSQQFGVDRFSTEYSVTSKMTIQQNAGSVTPPAGFSKYLGITSSSAYTVGASEIFYTAQYIEGLNVVDLAWGTASAATVTLSFWVRSSLTGTFGGAFKNSAANRSYPFTYTISSANTWEQKTITVPGDTTGTWLTTNGVGIVVYFGLGVGSTYSGAAGSWAAADYRSATGATSVVGTNGATFYITGVQLEKGTTATSFDYRPYGTELALCQRYYFRLIAIGGSDLFQNGYCTSTTSARTVTNFPVSMRTPPTSLEQTGTAANYGVMALGTTTNCSSVPTFGSSTSTECAMTVFTVASGLTAGQGTMARLNATGAYLGWSAEL